MNLRQAAQQALEALANARDFIGEEQYKNPTKEWNSWQQADELQQALLVIRAALAEPDSDYERGFVDGMNLQTKGSVGKAVNRMAEPEQEPVAWRLYKDGELYSLKFAYEDRGPNYTWEPLYTASTPRKPLTDEEIQSIWAKTFEMGSSANTFARAIEAHIRSRT